MLSIKLISFPAWIRELSAAGRGENLVEDIDYAACYAFLELNINDQPSPADINRAYRKMALKHHPDKGGDMKDVSLLHLYLQTLKLKMPHFSSNECKITSTTSCRKLRPTKTTSFITSFSTRLCSSRSVELVRSLLRSHTVFLFYFGFVVTWRHSSGSSRARGPANPSYPHQGCITWYPSTVLGPSGRWCDQSQ